MRGGESPRLVPSNSHTKLQTPLEVMGLCKASLPPHPAIKWGNQMWHPPHPIHLCPSSFGYNYLFFFGQYLGFNLCPETHALRHSTSRNQYACVTQGWQHLPDQNF